MVKKEEQRSFGFYPLILDKKSIKKGPITNRWVLKTNIKEAAVP